MQVPPLILPCPVRKSWKAGFNLGSGFSKMFEFFIDIELRSSYDLIIFAI